MVRSERQPADAGDDLTLLVFRLFGVVLIGSLRAAVRLAWWAVLFPMLSVPVLGSIYAGQHAGRAAGITVAIGSAVLLLIWRLTLPGSFERIVSRRIRQRWRRWAVYQHRWSETCALHGLTATLNDAVLVPQLVRARIGAGVDTLTVRMLLGQDLSDWQANAAALAHAFGAREVRVSSPTPGWVSLAVHHGDTLAKPIRLPHPERPVDLESLTIGVTEDGSPWTVGVLGQHLLVAGATGAGKGSVVWATLAALAPAIRDGLVGVWVIDPKGGMEFGAGRPLYTRFAYNTPAAMLALLADAAGVMTDRANRLRGIARLHTPSLAEPLVLVIIDEIATLTAYGGDRKTRAEIERQLGLLLSQGRAVGVSVIACVQDPSKDVLALRQLFPTRIALRLSEATQVPMVLGPGAREAGATCDTIPDTIPGVGYVATDGRSGVTRVRAFHVTDDDIDGLVATYRPHPVSVVTLPTTSKGGSA